MPRSILAIPFLCCVPLLAKAQLTISTAPTPQQLVQDILLGDGVTAFNITYNGVAFPPPNQPGRGSFTVGTSNLGLQSGVILASGNVMQAANPGTFFASTALNTGVDADLTLLAGTTIYDRSILQFDFIPTGDTLRFRYVFGSEEYPAYVCSAFNDAFGFFLSGPGIAGPFSNNSANIALIPGTNVPVTINTVNSGVPGSAGNAATCAAAGGPNWQQNNIYYVNNQSGATVAYNGLTTVLTAFALVECGETYRIKIAIGDGFDTGFDSAVFLEAGSFVSSGQVSTSLPTGVGVVDGNTMLEGCGPYELVFTRIGDLVDELVVDLSVGGTATPGVDYIPPFPTELVFPPGEATVSLFLDVPLDGDLLETIILTISSQNGSCAGGIVETEVTYFIDSAPPIQVQSLNINGTCGQTHVLSPNVNGALGAYTYLWSTGETTPSISVSPNETTSYTLTVSAPCGADPVTATMTVTLPNYQPLAIDVSVPTEIECQGTGTISVLSATGGDNNFTYGWTANGLPVGNGASITVPSGPPTWYVVTVTDGCGTNIQDSVLVTSVALTPIVIQLAPYTQTICNGTTVPLSITDISGGGGTYAWEWTDQGGGSLGSGNNISVSPGTTQTYTLSVTDQCGASASVDIPITVNSPVSAGANGALTLCSSQGVVDLFNSLGGTPMAGGTWSGPGGATGASFDPATGVAGNYTYTVVGPAPCPNASATVNVTVNTAPDAGTNAAGTFCSSGASVDLIDQLGGDPQSGGSWSGPGGAHNGVFNPSTQAAGVYTYTVSGVAPCVDATASLIVSVTAAPDAGTNASESLCTLGDPLDLLGALGGQPDGGGTWTGPTGLPFGGTVDPAVHPGGTYTYTVAGQAPCPNASATVTISLVAEASAGGPGFLTLCTSDPTTGLFSSLEGSPDQGGAWITPGGAPFTGTFNPATDTPGIYTYTVTPTLPCPAASATVTVGVITPPNAGTSNTLTVCSSGASVPLLGQLGGSPAPGGSWSNPTGGAFGGTFNPAVHASGIYTYTVTGTAPCPAATATVTMTVNTAPNAGTNQTLALCSDQTPVDLFASLGGQPNAGGSWQGPNGAFNGPYNPAIHTPGAYTYTVTGLAPCANATATLTIGVTQAPNAGGSSSLLLCPEADPIDLFDQLAGSPNAGGTWTNASGGPNNGTFDPANNPAGNYTYTVTSGPACPPAIATVTVSFPSQTPPFAGNNAVVCDLTFTLAAADNWESGMWSGPAGIYFTDPNSPTSGISATQGGSYTLTWSTLSQFGCVDEAQVTIILTEPMSATAIATDALCHNACNGTVTVQTSGGNLGQAGYGYAWPAGVSGNANGTGSNICAGEHMVTVSDANGCTAQASFSVAQPPPVSIEDVTATRVTCPGDCDGTISVVALDGVAFSVDNGMTWQTGTEFEGLCAGNWTVTVQDSVGCTSFASIAVPNSPPITAAFTWSPFSPVATDPGVWFQSASSSNVVSWSWDLGGLGSDNGDAPFFLFPGVLGGSYTVCLTVTNEDGCTDEVCRTIVVRDELEGHLPNAFTPDGDGLNDLFIPVFSHTDVMDYEFLIFDRWGEQVFQSVDLGEGWDGTLSGKLVKTEVFVWILRYRAPDSGDRVERRGHVTVLR